MRAGCVALAFLAACGGTYGGKSPAKPKTGGASGAEGGIERAALPYSILDARTGHQIDTEQFWQKLGAARVVCVGEDHPNPHHHWVQLEVMTQLAAHQKGKKKLALGMEMFQRPFQGILDDYAAKRIDEATLLSRSGWEDRWGYDYGFYGPTIRTAVSAGASLVALNAPRELTKAVARKGIAGLAPDEKAQLPEINLDDKVHRAWFDTLMEGMGGAQGHTKAETKDDAKNDDAKKEEEPAMPPGHPAMPSADNIYAAQVVWDESMADGAAKWAQANAQGEMVLLAGNGHCHDSAIVNRVKRRGVNEVVSVRPVLDTEGNVAEALAKPMNDYLVVLQLPQQ
ncbi:MAG TPA: ChaN family lipoprotein [Kofleriaceae bacterium]|nr:ChaN family lipoprotein [Kofleriaceae bacterium]